MAPPKEGAEGELFIAFEVLGVVEVLVGEVVEVLAFHKLKKPGIKGLRRQKRHCGDFGLEIVMQGLKQYLDLLRHEDFGLEKIRILYELRFFGGKKRRCDIQAPVGLCGGLIFFDLAQRRLDFFQPPLIGF